MCPFCGGDVEYAGISSGYIFPDVNTGQMYLCKVCGYQGSFIMEFDDPEDVRKMREYLIANQNKIEPQSFSFPENWRKFWMVMAIMAIVRVAAAIVISMI